MINIRQIKKSDLDKLAKIYSIVYKRFDIGEKWTPKTAKKLLYYWFKKQPDLFFLAEYNSKIVGGFVAGVKPWWDGNHLSDGEIFVRPNYQKKGIATKLSIALYKKALKKYKIVCFDGFTFKKTKFPLSWYLSQGFIQNKDWTMISGDINSILLNLKNK